MFDNRPGGKRGFGRSKLRWGYDTRPEGKRGIRRSKLRWGQFGTGYQTSRREELEESGILEKAQGPYRAFDYYYYYYGDCGDYGGGGDGGDVYFILCIFRWMAGRRFLN